MRDTTQRKSKSSDRWNMVSQQTVPGAFSRRKHKDNTILSHIMSI